MPQKMQAQQQARYNRPNNCRKAGAERPHSERQHKYIIEHNVQYVSRSGGNHHKARVSVAAHNDAHGARKHIDETERTDRGQVSDHVIDD